MLYFYVRRKTVGILFFLPPSFRCPLRSSIINDTSSCVMVNERFVARRCVPGHWRHLFDNGTNFVATENRFLNNIVNLNKQALTALLVKKSVKNKSNPPGKPHHGFLWQRLVHSFKHAFFAVLCNRRLTGEFFHYFLFCQANPQRSPDSSRECRCDRVRCSHSKPLSAGNSWLKLAIFGKS